VELPALMRLDDALAGVNRLGIDTAPVIYLLERDPARLPVLQELARQINSGRLTAFASPVDNIYRISYIYRYGK